jgi:hypothetical protein
MEREIKSIEIIGAVNDKLNANHDVIVELSDGKSYIATFFTLINIQYLMGYYKHYTGECNRGAFFWASDMCIIEVFEEDLLRTAITTMINDHYFDNVFKLVNNASK